MTQLKRIVFFVSDSTGITAETVGHSLLSQFDAIDFEHTALRYIDTEEKARAACETINNAASTCDDRPLVFSTLVDGSLRDIVAECNAVFFDLFDTFIDPLEQELQLPSSHRSGRTHGVLDDLDYASRIDAVNYAMRNDDGISTTHYQQADIILFGVSRTGKTPTCLYLALHYGVFAANYPLTEEELLTTQLPPCLKSYQDKLFGLTISAERLQRIRSQRRPDSRYSTLAQCRQEISLAEDLFQTRHISHLDASQLSVEEIATNIMNMTSLE